MNTQYHPQQFEQTNFQSFDLIYEGIKMKGIYLLEYQDAYLKDAFVTQLVERFIDKGVDALFIQKEPTQYALSDIFLSRTLFKQNPHIFPSLSQITGDSVVLLKSTFAQQFQTLEQKTSILAVKSKHPMDYLHLMFEMIKENTQQQIVVIDSHTDYFYKMNLIPQLKRMSFDRNVTILFTSKVSTEKFINKSAFLPSFIEKSFYLHSEHIDLYSLSDSKKIAYDFELDIRLPSNKRLKSYFTLFPSSAYALEA